MSDKAEMEALNVVLCDPERRRAYQEPYDSYSVSFLPNVLGFCLVWCGNLVYGRKPSYLKFRAVEVIARVPYQSWVSAAYTLLTLFYSSEERALRYSHLSEFARLAQDNETMHVIVISKLAREESRAGVIRYTLIPMLFAFVYFWISYVLYFINKRYSMELNYCFENHAYEQYIAFLALNESDLKAKPIVSDFLSWYGRSPISQYEFFESVRNDELIHRNVSIHKIQQK